MMNQHSFHPTTMRDPFELPITARVIVVALVLAVSAVATFVERPGNPLYSSNAASENTNESGPSALETQSAGSSVELPQVAESDVTITNDNGQVTITTNETNPDPEPPVAPQPAADSYVITTDSGRLNISTESKTESEGGTSQTRSTTTVDISSDQDGSSTSRQKVDLRIKSP